MPDLTANDVEILRSWNEGGMAQKDLIGKRVKITLNGQGGLTNTCPASAFGLTVLESCSGMFVKDDDSQMFPAAVSATGDKLLFVNIEAATDANRADPADLTGTFIGIVKGY